MDTFNAVADKLTPLFSKIADKIGQGAEWGWTVMIKHEYMIAMENYIVSFASLLAFITLVFVCKYTIKMQKQERYGSYELGTGFSIAGMIIIFFIFWACLIGGINHSINPDYYSIQDLADIVKGNPNQ